jgi:UDP-4-amino-4-deoxy-L-arabinose-oxoglutarate aminotransferase
MTASRAPRTAFLPFSRPSISEADVAAVAAVMRSGWLTTGPRAAEFETRFAACAGSSGAVALSSATAGMQGVLQALGIGPGDEVVTPSMTWVSTPNLIVLAGATPVFAEVDRDTLMMTPATLAPCLTARTKAIVPVHFAGAPADLDPLRRLAAERGIPLVEDAAHALGTAYKGEPVGRRGTAVFSFHPIKAITTGEGGMVCSDDPALLDRVRRFRFHGLGADAFDRLTHGRTPQAEVQEPGYKYNLTDMAAALGLSQLARLEALNRKRGELAGLYRDRLAGVPELLPLADPAYPHTHARHLLIVRLTGGGAAMNRDVFMAELKKRQIGTGLHFRAVHLHRYYRERLGLRRGMLPETEWNADRICSLPLFPDMTEDDVDDVVAAIKDVLI